jgi:hypothetical protein
MTGRIESIKIEIKKLKEAIEKDYGPDRDLSSFTEDDQKAWLMLDYVEQIMCPVYERFQDIVFDMNQWYWTTRGEWERMYEEGLEELPF